MPRILRILLATWPALLLAYGYAGLKLYHACVANLPFQASSVRLGLGAIVVFCNLYPLLLVLRHFITKDQRRQNPGDVNRFLDLLLAYPFWTGVILLVELLPWLLILDFIKLPLYPLFDRLRGEWLLIQHRVVLAILALYMLFILTRVFIDTVRIKVVRIVLLAQNISASLHGLRIVHISDIHLDKRTKARRLKRYVRKVNKLSPDVVFFTGDLSARDGESTLIAAGLLGQVRSKYGVFACLGDDETRPGMQMACDTLTENQVTVLNNKNHLVRARGDSLLLTVITNTYAQRPNLDNLSFLMGQQPRGTLDIIITHQPNESIVELASERGYHLFLAGHTHGGQVIVRPFGARLTPARMETPFFKGVYNVGRMLVNVSSGLGFKDVPIRCRAPAEVSLIQVMRRR
ncbi:MAG: metallophosphoesterase [bacterium]